MREGRILTAAAASDARRRLCIVSPAPAGANNGNARTARRWQGFLAPLHDVSIRQHWDGAPCDALIALHALRSADSVAAYRAARPGAPLAVVLTGTDLYRDLAGGNAEARAALSAADAVVVLQEAALERLDDATRRRTRVIVQSTPALRAGEGSTSGADFVAVGHLREEKDPRTLMRAACLLAEGGAAAVRIDHIGAALDESLAAAARETMASCPGYRWLGAVPHRAARGAIAGARALVHPSRMEGGAHVVIEAVRSGVPVLASRIDGNVGLLGAGYGGYFPLGDAAALAALMRRFLAEPAFAAGLAAQCAAREPGFRPAAERRAVRRLVADLLGAGEPSR